jgi:cytoskeletal protein CcmA (bactofilin family)
MGILSSRKSPEPGSSAPAPAGLSVVAAGMAVHGNLDSNGTVRIEGVVEGDVSTRAQALVAKGGVVRGDMAAEEVVVGGTVTGAVRARVRVEIQSGAVVEGDVTTRRIMVAEGATLNGRVRMGEEAVEDPPAAGMPPRHESAAGSATVSPRVAIPVARVAVPPHRQMP